MLAHGHLQDRAGEKVHIISTFVSGQIKEDGERNIDPSKYHRIVRHVNNGLFLDSFVWHSKALFYHIIAHHVDYLC